MAGYTTGAQTSPPLKLVARALRQSDKKLAAKLGRVNKAAAKPVETDARARARSRQQQHFAGGIKAKGSASEVAVSIGGQPGTVGAFMGAVAWKQFPEWVGNGWEVGGDGGPRAVNPAIAAYMPKLLEDYGDAVADVWAEAFDEARKG